MTEITVGRWKVRRIDSNNWQVFEHREVRQSSKTKRAGEADWMACPAFFGRLEHALEWCLDRESCTLGEHDDIKAAVHQFRAIKTEFANELRRMFKESSE